MNRSTSSVDDEKTNKQLRNLTAVLVALVGSRASRRSHTRAHTGARGICGARVRGRPLRRPESFYLSPTMRLPRRWRRPRLIEPAAAPANPHQSADYTNTAADNATTMLSQQWSGTGTDNGYANVASNFSPTSFLVFLFLPSSPAEF